MKTIKNKKGSFGINTVVTVALALFVLLLIAIAIIVGSNALLTTTVFPVTAGDPVINNTITATSAGVTLSQAGLDGISCSITRVINATTGVVITSPNYTLVAPCSVANATAKLVQASGQWNVDYTYTAYSTSYNQVNGIIGNNSVALTGFFANSGTFFSILAIVVIMIFLGLMIGAVYLFASGKKEGGI